MIKPVVLCFILLCFNTIGQVNLVYNGDFEIYDTCPTGFSDPFQNPKQIEHCTGWNAPTYGTSDYFNSCSSGTNVAVPNNPMGEQNPYNGNGYLGSFFTSYNGGSGTDGYSGIMWWEYIQGKLIQPLQTNKTYKLSMEISLAEYSDLMINEIGAYFSGTPLSTNNSASLSLIPQCVFYNVNFYSDTVNWMHLETTFVATGGEQYVVIGNFRNNITTDTLRRYDLEPFDTNPFVTYFYIDNVVLIENNFQSSSNASFEFSNVFTPNNDGTNDLWKLPSFIDSTNKVVILNRWGNIVSEGKVGQFKWDGKDQSGDDCTDGIYFYRIEGTDKQGFIHLIR